MGGVVKSVGGLFGIQSGQSQGEKALSEASGQATMEAMRQAEMLKALQPQQTEFGNALAASALGKENSLAQLQMKAAQDRSLAQQLAIARSNRGVNPALASRMQARMGAEATQMGAQNALTAQRQAQSDFANYLGQQQNYTAGLLGGSTQGAAQRANTEAQRIGQENKIAGGFMNAVTGGGASLLMGGEGGDGKDAAKQGASLLTMFSDEEKKENIKENKPEQKSKNSASSFLDALQSYSYDYKDKKHGNGKHVSIMAQDLEKAGPIGKSMVENTPEGKMVNYAKGLGAILAAQTELNERLKKIETKKRG